MKTDFFYFVQFFFRNEKGVEITSVASASEENSKEMIREMFVEAAKLNGYGFTIRKRDMNK